MKYGEIDWSLLSPVAKYRAWLAAHDTTQRDHARSGGVDQGTLSAVVRGTKASAPVSEWLRRETGIDL